MISLSNNKNLKQQIISLIITIYPLKLIKCLYVMEYLKQIRIYSQKILPQIIKYYQKINYLQLLVYSNNKIKFNKRKNKIKIKLYQCVNKIIMVLVNKTMRKILLVKIKIALNGKIAVVIQINQKRIKELLNLLLNQNQ